MRTVMSSVSLVSDAMGRHMLLTSTEADPDRSNPTRNRLERPLDTIRSFNAAAEGTSSRRTAPQSNPRRSRPSDRMRGFH